MLIIFGRFAELRKDRWLGERFLLIKQWRMQTALHRGNAMGNVNCSHPSRGSRQRYVFRVLFVQNLWLITLCILLHIILIDHTDEHYIFARIRWITLVLPWLLPDWHSFIYLRWYSSNTIVTELLKRPSPSIPDISASRFDWTPRKINIIYVIFHFYFNKIILIKIKTFLSSNYFFFFMLKAQSILFVSPIF